MIATTLTVTSPQLNHVFQRGNNNVGYAVFSGQCPLIVKTVQVTITPLAGQGTSQGTYTLPVQSGQYAGRIAVNGGWYTATVKADTGQTIKIDQWGVGEVLINFGHSVAAGVLNAAATDPRVITVSRKVGDISSDENLSSYKFQTISDGVGPFNTETGQMAYLGDALVQKYQVPVLILGSAFGGSNIDLNWKVLRVQPFFHGFINYEKGMPFRPLQASLQLARSTGLRAVLSQHGINDAGTDDFYNKYREVIDRARNILPAPWLVVLDYTPSWPDFESKRNDIRELWKLPYVYPSFDFQQIVNIIADPNDKIHPRTVAEHKALAAANLAALDEQIINRSAAQLAGDGLPVISPDSALPITTPAPVIGNELQVANLLPDLGKTLKDIQNLPTESKRLLTILLVVMTAALLWAILD